MKDKIAQLMKMEGLSTSRLAELLEIQPSAVSHLVSGRNNPRFDLVQRILSRFPNINPDWLLLDSGEMYRDGEGPNVDADSDALLTLFDEEALPIPNNPLSESLKSIENSQNTPHTPSKPNILTRKEGAPKPVRLIILYDDGSFENFSMRE